LVLETAKDAGLRLETTQRVTKLFEEALKQGRGRDGTQALFEIVRKSSR